MTKGRTHVKGTENGRGRSLARCGSTECRHPEFGRLAIERPAGVFDRQLGGLPAFTDDLFVGCDGALGRHSKRVRLQELAFAPAVEADRTVEVLGRARTLLRSSCGRATWRLS